MAFNNAEIGRLQSRLADFGAEVERPLGGGIGKDGDCLMIVGMQQDVPWGPRQVPDPDGCGAVISRILSSLESRRESRWVICAVKDWFPREHCSFGDRGTRYREREFSIAATQGSRLFWRVRQPLSVMRARTSRRVVVGFKNYHESVLSCAAFPYTQELVDDLADVGARRDRDFTRHVSKLLVYSGSVAARCSSQALARRADPADMDAPPDVMAMEPQGQSKRAPQLNDALRQALGNKQVRRLFICGVPFDEDVLDTALSAACARPSGQKVAGNVYIVVDATRPRSDAKNDDEAELQRGDPDALRRPRTPTARELVGLLSKYGVRLCSFAHLVAQPLVPRVERVNPTSLMFLPVGAMYLKLFAPQLVTPVQPGGEPEPPMPVLQQGDGIERDDDDGSASPGAAVIDDDDDDGSPGGGGGGGGGLDDLASPTSPTQDVDTADLALARRQALEEAADVLSQTARFDGYVIRNDRGEWEMADLHRKQRLGWHLCKWLGRADESGGDDFRPGCPVLRLRTKFPASLSSLNLVVDPSKMGTANIFGTELFQLRSEEAVLSNASYGFATHCGAMLHLHRVLAKVVSAKTLSFYTARIDVPISQLSDPNSHHPGELVREADLTVRALRQQMQRPSSAGSRGNRGGIATPKGSKGSGRSSTSSPSASGADDLLYDAEWWAARQRQLADEWQNELFQAAEMGRWVTERRRRLQDQVERREFDHVCSFSISELATMGVSFCRCHLVTSGRPNEENQVAYRGGASHDVLVVQACGPDFSHPRAGAFELGKHFEHMEPGRDGAWLPDGKRRLAERATNTWRCVMRAFQSERCADLSLVPLCAEARELAGLPMQARAAVTEIYLKALLQVLEDSWGFLTVYLFVGDPALRKQTHHWVEDESYGFCTNVVVHDRDPKFLAWELNQRGRYAGLLCPADPAAVLLGAVGGHWEKCHSSSYGMAEDLAHTSTMLLSHVGVRNDGIATDKVIFHAADTPVAVLLGHPSERAAVRWHRPGGVAMSATVTSPLHDTPGEPAEEPPDRQTHSKAPKQASKFAVPAAAPAAAASLGGDSDGSREGRLDRLGTGNLGRVRPGSGHLSRPGSAASSARPGSGGRPPRPPT